MFDFSTGQTKWDEGSIKISLLEIHTTMLVPHTHTHTHNGVRKFKGLRLILVNSQILFFLWLL